MKKVYVLVNRAGKAVLMNEKKQYKIAEDKDSTIASMRLLARFLKSIKDVQDEVVIIIPKNLIGLMKMTNVFRWEERGNKTISGKQLSEEYVALAREIMEARCNASAFVEFKLQGASDITNTEKIYVNLAWKCMNAVVAPQSKAVVAQA